MLENEVLIPAVLSVLDDLKAREVVHLDVEGQSDFADDMIITTGTSSRHVAAIVENVVYQLKQLGQVVLGVEGDRQHSWVLIDVGDLVVHVMQDEARSFYALETLWLEEQDIEIQANP